MLITTPEELRAFLPSHTYRNLDTVRGYLQNSELTFLRQRIGQPLLDALNRHYTDLGPIVGTPIGTDGSVADDQEMLADPWRALILLCQRCIVYDAFARASDIMAISANDMGLNIAESENYDAANDKRVDRYKAQLIKESHAATDLLFLQLEAWEREESKREQEASNLSQSEESENENISEDLLPSTPLNSASDIKTILELWQQSETCYLNTGLLFNTATEFNTYVDIYDSRERFITLLPDIRYCQELHLEAEIGPELLTYLHDGHRAGTLTPEQTKAYTMLQRCLSLYVEARAKMFNRPAARDEAQGYMHLTQEYIRNHQTDTPHSIISLSPLYNPRLWHFDETTNQYVPLSSVTSQPSSQSQNPCHAPSDSSVNAKPGNTPNSSLLTPHSQCNCDCSGTMLISTLI